MHLTQEEKIRLVTGNGMWHTDACSGKLPQIHLSDGPHGLRKQEEKVKKNNDSHISTCFPTESAIACSWDTDIAAQMAQAIAQEAKAERVSILLGPGVNMKRSPLCGRNFEYFSEDPFLAGKMAAAYIRAVQRLGIGTSLKHFAGNSQETHRQTANSQIDERALREIYLAAFEIAVTEAQPATVMASYNRLNGVYACENAHLLTDILREEWGFSGAVVSDWGACVDLPASIRAGMDLEMPDTLGQHTKKLRAAMREGTLTQQELDTAAARVAVMAETYAPDCGQGEAGIPPEMLHQHHELARKLACSSAVLLKNDGILPLKAGADILVVGDMAVSMRFQGGGSSHIRAEHTPNAVRALEAAGFTVQYVRGYNAAANEPNAELESQALEAAAEGRTILFFGGLTERAEGEGYDRKTLDMPENQKELFEKLLKISPDIVLVSLGGAPYIIPSAEDTRAILHMYLGGEAVDSACADLLSGRENPRGKLAETWPASADEVPCGEWFGKNSDDVEYRESIFIGYRYYDTWHRPVQFAFGHGCSYTSFSYSGLYLSKEQYTGGTLSASLTVTNSGDAAGYESVQIYVKNPVGKEMRPEKELRGFGGIFLKPGESGIVTIPLTERSFSVYSTEKQAFVMLSGTYQVLAAAASDDIRLYAEIVVQGEDDSGNTMLPSYFARDTKIQIPEEEFAQLYGRTLSRFDSVHRGEYTLCNSIEQLAKASALARILRGAAKLAARIFYHGRPADDPEVMMMTEGALHGTLDSVVYQSGGLVSGRIAEAIVLSANGHPFRAFQKIIGG